MLHIGLKIKELMDKEKIDSPELAEKMGVTKQAVYAWITKPDANTSVLRKLSSIFDVPLTYFVSEGSTYFSAEEKEELISLRAQNALLREMVGLSKNKGEVSKNVS